MVGDTTQQLLEYLREFRDLEKKNLKGPPLSHAEEKRMLELRERLNEHFRGVDGPSVGEKPSTSRKKMMMQTRDLRRTGGGTPLPVFPRSSRKEQANNSEALSPLMQRLLSDVRRLELQRRERTLEPAQEQQFRYLLDLLFSWLPKRAKEPKPSVSSREETPLWSSSPLSAHQALPNDSFSSLPSSQEGAVSQPYPDASAVRQHSRGPSPQTSSYGTFPQEELQNHSENPLLFADSADSLQQSEWKTEQVESSEDPPKSGRKVQVRTTPWPGSLSLPKQNTDDED